MLFSSCRDNWVCLEPGLDGAALYIAVKRGHLDSIFAPACSIRLNETWRSISYLLLSLYYFCVFISPLTLLVELDDSEKFYIFLF